MNQEVCFLFELIRRGGYLNWIRLKMLFIKVANFSSSLKQSDDQPDIQGLHYRLPVGLFDLD